jgi:hypothetical protein
MVMEYLLRLVGGRNQVQCLLSQAFEEQMGERLVWLGLITTAKGDTEEQKEIGTYVQFQDTEGQDTSSLFYWYVNQWLYLCRYCWQTSFSRVGFVWATMIWDVGLYWRVRLWLRYLLWNWRNNMALISNGWFEIIKMNERGKKFNASRYCSLMVKWMFDSCSICTKVLSSLLNGEHLRKIKVIMQMNSVR